MEIVEYPVTLQWVGTMRCNSCQKSTYAWRSSGMSGCYPHFYCDRCSNVIHRSKDEITLVENAPSKEILDRIAEDLPICPCGGRFMPGTNPKCIHCSAEFAHQHDPVQRLHDPHMIVVDGACVFSDTKEPYKVVIGKNET